MLWLWPTPALAASPAFDTLHRFGAGGAASVATGDVNGDGALDLIVGSNCSGCANNAVYLNDGNGNFDSGAVNCALTTTRCFGPTNSNPTTVAVGDMNGDGALDLLASPDGGQAVVYLNDGSGHFDVGPSDCNRPATRCFGLASAPTSAVAVGDVNGDGALDLIVSPYREQSVVYLNDGSGHFDAGPVDCQRPSVRCFGATGLNVAAVAVGDVNGDGALDIIAGGSFIAGTFGGQSVIYLNDGAGHFYTGAVDCSQPSTSVRCFGTGQDLTTALTVADVNGDKALDIVVADGFSRSSSSRQSLIYLNDGAGHFYAGPVDCAKAALPVRCFGITDYVASVAIGDVNNDGALDIIAGTPQEGTFGVVYFNDGSGHFAAGGVDCNQPAASIRCFGLDRDETLSVAVGDLNGDGALDLVAGNFGNNALYLSNGAGQFATEIGDCNQPSALAHCFGLNAANSTRRVATGDFNGDGALDLVVNTLVNQPAGGNQVYVNAIYFNDGAGHFAYGPLTCAQPPATVRCFGPISDAVQSVAIGDMNGDGALDLVVFTTSASSSALQNYILFNDGRGHFYTGPLDCSQPPANVRCFGANNQRVQPGYFELSDTQRVAVGDLNGDGALDIAVSMPNDQSDANIHQNVVYLNDGSGHFYTGPLDCSQPAANVRCFGTNGDRVAVDDFNNDGVLDLVVANIIDTLTPDGAYNAVYLNDGAAHFATGPMACTNPLPHTACFGATGVDRFATGDVNGDGALDLVVPMGQAVVVYLNDGSGNFDHGVINCTNPASYTRCLGDNTFASTRSIAVADVNGDGALDLVVANGDDDTVQQSVVYLNDGAGHFYSGPIDCNRPAANIRCFGNGSDMRSVAVGDVNGDGVPDLVVGNHSDYPNVIYLNGSRLAAGLAPNLPAAPPLQDSQIIPITYTLQAPPAAANRPQVIGYITAQYSLNGGGNWRPAIATSATITANLGSGQRYVYQWDTLASGFFGQADNVVIRLVAYFQTPTGVVAQPGVYRYLNAAPGPFQSPYLAGLTPPFRVRGTQVRVIAENQNGAQDQSGVADALIYKLPAGQNSGGQSMRDGANLYHTTEQGYLTGRGVLKRGDQLLALWPVPGQHTDKFTLYYTSGQPINSGLAAVTVAQGGVQTLTVTAANPLLLFDLTVSLEWDASKDMPFQQQLAEDLQRASRALYDWTDGQVALGKVTVYQAKQHWGDADVQILASNQVRPNAARGGLITQTLTLPFHKPDEPAQVIGPGKVHIGPTWNRYGESGAIGEDWPRTLAHELGHYLLYLEDTYLGLNPRTKVLEAVTTCTGTAMSDPYQEPFSEFRTDDATWAADCGRSLAELPDWALITNRYPALHQPTVLNAGPTTMPFAFTQVAIQPAFSDANHLIDDPTVQLDGAGLANGRVYLIRPGAHMVALGRPVGTAVLARGAQVGDEVCLFDQTAFACDTYTNNTPLRLHAQPAWSPQVTLTPSDATTVQMLVSNPDGDGAPLTAALYPNGEFFKTITIASGVTTTLTFSAPVQNLLIDLVGSAPATQHQVTGYALSNGPGRKWSHDTFTSGDGGVVLFPPAELASDGTPDGVLILQTVTQLPAFPNALHSIGQAYAVRSNKATTQFHDGSISFQYLGTDVLLSGYPEQSLVIHYWDGVTWRQLETTLNSLQNIASAPLPGPGNYVLTGGTVQLDVQTLSPAAVVAGQAQTLMISGFPTATYFMEPLRLTLVGETGVTYPLSVTAVTSQTIVAQTPLTLPADLYGLQLQHPGSPTVNKPNALAVYSSQPATTCFFDDFSSGLRQWAADAAGEWGIVTRDGWEAVTDSPNHPYRSAEPGQILTTTLTSQPFTLATCRSASNDPNVVPVLTFRHAYQLLPNDFLAVELSIDNGVTWHKLASYPGAALAQTAELPDNEWRTVNWQTTTLSLAGYEDAATLRLRFTLQADDHGSAKGWLIDEVTVAAALPPTGENEHGNKLFLPLVSPGR